MFNLLPTEIQLKIMNINKEAERLESIEKKKWNKVMDELKWLDKECKKDYEWAFGDVFNNPKTYQPTLAEIFFMDSNIFMEDTDEEDEEDE